MKQNALIATITTTHYLHALQSCEQIQHDPLYLHTLSSMKEVMSSISRWVSLNRILPVKAVSTKTLSTIAFIGERRR
jgi:hypothetical protein